MIDELAIVLSTLFGTQVHKEERGLRTLVRSGDSFFTTRVRIDPVAEIFIATRPLDGFELALRWNDRWGSPGSAAPFEDAFLMTTNDDTLSRWWLDDVSKQALLGSAYGYEVETPNITDYVGAGMYNPSPRATATLRRTWTYELGNDELVATKGGVEHNAERLRDAITTGCVLAERSQRWAREYADLAQKIGASARREIELGGRPIITATRSAVDVSLQLLRRLPGERSGRLRTLITAKRVSHDERTFSILDETAGRGTLPKSLPKKAEKNRPLELAPYRFRASDDTIELDELTKKLLVAARPICVDADLDSIDIWYDGAPQQHDCIDAAFAMAAHLAVGNAAQQGPYR